MDMQTSSSSTFLGPDWAGIDQLIGKALVPRVTAIDLDGEYPEAFLRALGELGGFAGVVDRAAGGSGGGLGETLAVMAKVGETCLSTAFALWCQTACARYIQLSANAEAQSRYLPGLSRGHLLGGTGLSNTLKSCCGIEAFRLSATRVSGGYRIEGTLPWVSNLGEDHIFVTGCPVHTTDGQGEAGQPQPLVFFVVACGAEGFRLVRGASFTALEGTRTLACQFRGVFIPDADILAHPADAAAYLARIQPGMVLAQLGMGVGLVRDCIRLIERGGRSHGHINAFEADQAEDLGAALAAAEAELARLVIQVDGAVHHPRSPDDGAALLLAVLKLRLAGGELALRAAQAAMLHEGARGYLREATAQRRLREAYFIAIVTPALKHLRREIARREGVARR